MRLILVWLLVASVGGLLAGPVAAAEPDAEGKVLRLADLPPDCIVLAHSPETPAGFYQHGYTRWFACKTTSYRSFATYVYYRPTVKATRKSTHSEFEKLESDGSKRLTVRTRIGDEARIYMQTADDGRTVIWVIWRYGLISAGIYARGPLGAVDASEVLLLARTQQARIATALK